MYLDNLAMQVSADVVSIWTEKSDNITLDIFTCLLPVLTSLLESKVDRYVQHVPYSDYLASCIIVMQWTRLGLKI